MSKTDVTILSLKKQIEEKREELQKKKFRFAPETNCILPFEGNSYNINVVSENILKLLLIKLNMYAMSARELKMKMPEFGGYSVELWMEDIKNRLALIELKNEEADLKAKEDKLSKLLSNDKKTELAIQEIADSLGLSV
ncbi:MAG: hypothetical protein DBX58_06280 [Clostridiales bacterium]|nr:MAG: hypothetical protein DBX58_06280 [Clostridiales bacterium]